MCSGSTLRAYAPDDEADPVFSANEATLAKGVVASCMYGDLQKVHLGTGKETYEFALKDQLQLGWLQMVPVVLMVW
jgi:hypothetical protein